MRVLFIVNDLDFFLSHRLPIAKKLINLGISVFVVSNKIPLKKNSKITFFKIKIHRSRVGVLDNYNSIIELKKIIKQVNPKLIHCITLKPILFTNILLLRNKKIKIINAISGLGFLFTNKRNSFIKFLIKRTFSLIIKFKEGFFIFQNETDLEEFKALGLKNSYKIIKGSGVDSNTFEFSKPIKTNKVVIVYTSRILKDKGILDLIKAFNSLDKKSKENAVLKIYGKIDTNNPSFIDEDDFKKLLISDKIEWKGFTRRIDNVLKQSDIYCLPSYREGLPKSTVEAMAIGRPILTTNAPGCNDTVIEGYNGYKVPVNSPLELSKKLKDLISNQKLRLNMGKKSRELFEKEFTLEKIIDQTIDVYKNILKVKDLDNNKFKL